MSLRAGWLPVLTAIVLGLTSLSAEEEKTRIWTYRIKGQGEVRMELPYAWTEVARDKRFGAVRFRTRDAPRADLTLVISWSDTSDPGFNGSSRLCSLVDVAAREYLDQAVESRYTIRDLHGPESAGCYWSLRDRAPRKKWGLYLTRGMVGTGRVLIDFTLITPELHTPEIRQALKMIAGARQAEPANRP